MSRDDLDRLRSWQPRFSELGIDAPLSHPDNFKKALHIGEDAYKSLTIKRRSLKLLGPLNRSGGRRRQFTGGGDDLLSRGRHSRWCSWLVRHLDRGHTHRVGYRDRCVIRNRLGGHC